jgi:L-lactate dehydrogenase complex protein LldG
MQTSLQSRERMLSRIRVALGHPAGAPHPDNLKPFIARTPVDNGSLVDEFSEEARRVGGQVSQVQSVAEVGQYITTLLSADSSVAVSDGPLLQDLGLGDWLQNQGTKVLTADDHGSPAQYRPALFECAIGVTAAEYALADTGTLVLVSGGEKHRLISLLPPVHVCLLSRQNIFASLTQLLAHVHRESYSSTTPPQVLTCITGPSRTADIEQQITLGVHGPQSLHVLMYS